MGRVKFPDRGYATYNISTAEVLGKMNFDYSIFHNNIV